jgi:hypothetical protein
MDDKYYEAELNSVFDFLEYPPSFFVNSTLHNKEYLFDEIKWKFDGKPPSGNTLYDQLNSNDNYISTIRLPCRNSNIIVVHANKRFRRVIDVLMLISKTYSEQKSDLVGMEYDGFIFEDETKTWTMKLSYKY